MAENRRLWSLMLSSWKRASSLSSNPAYLRRTEIRALSSSSSEAAADYSGELDEINTKFAEAREEIDMASESKETVYFNEEAQTARDAVKLVLDKYQALLDKLPDSERASVQRSMGLKMEQLKAELQQLDS